MIYDLIFMIYIYNKNLFLLLPGRAPPGGALPKENK
jgi:hypothetical protein